MIRWAHLLILSLALGLLVAVIIQARSGGPAPAAPESPHAQAWQRSAVVLRGGYANVANLLDPKAGTPAAYGTSKYPETYLIDPRGRLVSKFIGPKPWGLQPLNEYIRDRISTSP